MRLVWLTINKSIRVNLGYIDLTPWPYLFWYKVAKKIRTTYDAGAVHLASEQLHRHAGNKAAADLHKEMVQRPWLARCLYTIFKKIRDLFPTLTPENEVSQPWPEPMDPYHCAALMLYKGWTVDNYRITRLSQKCKITGFTVNICPM